MDKSMDGFDGRLAGGGVVGGRGPSDARSALLELMVDSEDEFRRRTADRLAELPTYRAAPAGRLAGIVEQITWVYRTFLDCVSQRRDLSPAELGQLEAIGCARAGQSISLDEMHRAFQAVFDDSLVMLDGHARRLAADDPAALEVVPEFARSLSRFALQATEAMGRGHRRPDVHAALPPADVWIQQVLSAPSSGVAGEEGGRLPDLVIVLPAGPDAGLTALVDELAATFDTAVAGPVASDPVRHALVLVGHGLDGEGAARRYEQIARGHETVVVHGPVQDPGHMAESYRALRPRLGAVTPALPESGAVLMVEVMMLAMLSTVPDDVAEWFTAALLGPLLATSPDGPLFRTLEAFVTANGRTTDTARVLDVTPNTVRARLDRISELIGSSVRRDGALLQLFMALTLVKIHRDDWPPVGDPRWEAATAAW